MLVPDVTSRPIEHEQPARRTIGERMLRDLRAGKVVLEIGEAVH